MATKIHRVTREHAPSADSEVYQLRVNFNRLLDKWEALLAKLDEDSGVDDEDYVDELGPDSNGAPMKVLGHNE